MLNTNVNKAIVAVIGGIVTLLAQFGVDVSFLTEPLIGAIGATLTAFFVWLIPNKEK